tara:strand:+ start:692 stop:880 length:189 start_codon:yes stop_codon:yes gene_type:complete
MDDIGFILILAVAGIIYMIPTWISFSNNHPQAVLIMLVNIFAGWTGLAWLFLLMWALGNNKK